MKKKITNLLHFNRHVRRPLRRALMLMAMIGLMLVGVLGMTVLDADQEVVRKQGGLQSFPVTSGEIIYKGALVCVDADGYLLAAADTRGYKFVGIAYEKADNSGGGDGIKSCRVYTEGVFLLTCTSIDQTMVGQMLYVTDDDVVDESSTNYICVGRLMQYVSTTQGWVDIGQRKPAAGDELTQGHQIVVTVPAGKNALKILAYSETGGGSEGIGLYIEVHLTGADAGVNRGAGVWVNIDDGAVVDGALFVFDIGLYVNDDELTGVAVILNLDCQVASGSSPDKLAFIRTNSDQAGHDPDYLFYFNNDEAACLVKSDPGTSFYGYLKCISLTGNVILAIPVVNVT